jgi:hypothetical protein
MDKCHIFMDSDRIFPSLDIPMFLRIISATGEPKKAATEESRLAEAARDAQGKR